MKFLGKRKGFTLIEMLIVIVIIGVLASALIPRLGSARGRANDVARKADIQQIGTALISRQLDTNKTFDLFCGTDISCDIMSFSGELKGTLTTIPGDKGMKAGDSVNVLTGTAPTVMTGGGYFLIPIKKNGMNGNGFVLMAQVETEGGANFVACDTNNVAADYDAIQPTICNSVTKGTCNTAACTYESLDELRYVYMY